MLRLRYLLGPLAVVMAALLVAAACGSDTATTPTTGGVPTINDRNGLPLAETGEDAPIVAGMCAQGEPDCEDTIVVDHEVQDLPDTNDNPEALPNVADAATNSGMVVGGGLSIPEVLTTDATGIVAVRGHLFDDGSSLLFCERLVGLGERYGCGGEGIPITGLDPTRVPDVVFLEGTTYTELEIILFGEVVDGTLVVNDLVTG